MNLKDLLIKVVEGTALTVDETCDQYKAQGIILKNHAYVRTKQT